MATETNNGSDTTMSNQSKINALISKQLRAISTFDSVPEQYKHKVKKNIAKRDRKIKRMQEDLKIVKSYDSIEEMGRYLEDNG